VAGAGRFQAKQIREEAMSAEQSAILRGAQVVTAAALMVLFACWPAGAEENGSAGKQQHPSPAVIEQNQMSAPQNMVEGRSAGPPPGSPTTTEGTGGAMQGDKNQLGAPAPMPRALAPMPNRGQ
jgi:hypothetical protein